MTYLDKLDTKLEVVDNLMEKVEEDLCAATRDSIEWFHFIELKNQLEETRKRLHIKINTLEPFMLRLR